MQAVLVDETSAASAVVTQIYSFTSSIPTVTPPVSLLLVGRAITATTVPVSTSWSGSAFQGATIASYKLERRTGASTVFANIPLIPVTSTSLFDNLLSATPYVYRVTATDNRIPPKSSATVAGGSFAASVAQETVNSFRFAGTWLVSKAAGFSGGSARTSVTTGSTATITFTGRQVGWVSAVGPTNGIAAVTIDGVGVGPVDLYAPLPGTSRLVFVKSGLSNVPHTMVIRVTGTKNVKSTGARVDVDAIVSVL